MMEERIPVKILGHAYEILGNPADALYYNSLARYVEEKMKEVLEGTHIVSSQKIAVLTALNIADELFREKETKSTSGRSEEKKKEELIRLLEETLKESPSKSSPVRDVKAVQEPLLNFTFEKDS